MSPQDCEDLARADAEVRPGAAAFNVPDPMRRGETFEVHLVIDRRSPREIRVIEEALPTDLDTGNPGEAENSSSNLASPTDDPAANGASPHDAEGAAASGPDRNESTPELGAEGEASTPGQIVDLLPGSAERFFPPTGRHMRAELVGEAFDIAPLSEVSQEIPLGGSGSWIWSVTARKGGNHPLTLVTAVEGVVDGRRFILARTPRVKTVTVEVSLKDQIWDGFTEAPGWIKAVTAIVVALGGLLTAWHALPWGKRRRAAAKARARGKAGDKAGPGGRGRAPDETGAKPDS